MGRLQKTFTKKKILSDDESLFHDVLGRFWLRVCVETKEKLSPEARRTVPGKRGIPAKIVRGKP